MFFFKAGFVFFGNKIEGKFFEYFGNDFEFFGRKFLFFRNDFNIILYKIKTMLSILKKCLRSFAEEESYFTLFNLKDVQLHVQKYLFNLI